MTNIKKVFERFVESQKLQDQKLLLAVSGGVDSSVLLDVALKILPLENIGIFHVHHGVRPESDTEFEALKKFGETQKIPFYGYKIKKIPEKDRENYWREERRRFADQAIKEFDADRMLSAHHATDLVETMIFRMAKGSGLEGMSPFDVSTKPFWQISKSELVKYAKKNDVVYFEDETNTDTNYERNLIRQKVLPELRKITPNLEKVCVTESQIFSEARDFIQEKLQFELASSNSLSSVKVSDFQIWHPVLQREFLRYIAQKTPSFSETEDCLRWLLNNPKGNSTKEIGKTILKIKKGNVVWE